MIRSIPLLPRAALLVLSACQTPLEQCLSQADAPAADLRAQLAERNANLTRGYRLDQRIVTMPEFRLCAVPGSTQTVMCTEWVDTVHTQRTPIDPRVEAEAIALLERQLERAGRQAAQEARTCRATYPET